VENDKTLSDFFRLISEAKSEQNSNSVSESVQPQSIKAIGAILVSRVHES